MGLESLFAFTLLGGMAAGAYVFETCFARKRSGNRPWLLPLVVVVLFAIGMIAASTHVHSISRAMGSLAGGTVNFGSGMVREVAVSGVFFVLALIDMIATFVKKDSPFALRVVTAGCCGVHGAYGHCVYRRVRQCGVDERSCYRAELCGWRPGHGLGTVRCAWCCESV